jgi:hypothetical protein
METEEFDRNIDENDEPIEGETDESEMTGSAEPGTVATPEGTAEVDEELEDRGDA